MKAAAKDFRQIIENFMAIELYLAFMIYCDDELIFNCIAFNFND